MSCPPSSTRWRPKWGSSHFYSVDLLLLRVYDYGIVFVWMIITIIMVLYAQLLLWHCLYAKLWYYSFGEVLWCPLHWVMHRSC
jgi:hypothetical protein